MPKPLIIVESPAKARTITRFLGRRYQVLPSMGHVRDLPKSQFGVDVEQQFAPKYITIRGKGPVVKQLRDAAKRADRVYLATDPDREGEAISWHLASVLGIPDASARRIEFHEITKEAVERALKHSRPIHRGLVDAQQARRILDRVVGYQLSPLLWRKVRPGLSAGRVQSTALALLVDREREIALFTPEEYYTLTAALRAADGQALSASYAGPLGEKGRLADSEAAAAAASAGADAFVVAEVRRRERRRFAPPPFTTSTLQQEASKRLSMTVKRAMQVAQQLYEGLEVPGEGTVGLVTYIRTDSVRVSEAAEQEARAYVAATFGEAAVGPAGRRPADKAGVQGAHEAIRPTVVARHPSQLKAALARDQYRLYRLVWERFVGSLMAPAVFDTVSVTLSAGGHQFRASGQRLQSPGYTALYQDPDDPEAVGPPLPAVAVGETLALSGLEQEQHFTEPPPRYNEASLVRAMEELGIGRPSTYAPTVETLLSRDYVRREHRRLSATELGGVVVDLLRRYFPEIVDVEFTADMEKQLDRIEEGGEDWHALLQRFYAPFRDQLALAETAADIPDLPREVVDKLCPDCGLPLVIKHGRFGRFLACTGYPGCQHTEPWLEPTGALCPQCERPVVVRRSKKGRVFYGCSGYPECRFVSWYRPSGKNCPQCGAFLAERGRSGQGGLYCAREGCGYEERRASGGDD